MPCSWRYLESMSTVRTTLQRQPPPARPRRSPGIRCGAHCVWWWWTHLSRSAELSRYLVDRASAKGLQVVGITGSVGKTSTKDLLAQVLERVGPTVAAAGNLNNELGVPLTVGRVDEQTRFLVAEMGARGIGHIAYLCDIAPPRVGVVLNVGQAHVGEFGGRAAIAQAKGELVEALPA